MHKKVKSFIGQLIQAYSDDNISSLSAALAYYTIFALAPVLIICIALAGVFLGSDVAHARVLETTGGIIDPYTAQQIQTMVLNASKPFHSEFAHLTGICILVFAALGVFHEVQQGLNTIWGVKSNPERPWLKMILDRVFSFAMVLIIAFLLLLFLILSVTLTALSSWLSHMFGTLAFLGLTLNYLLSFCIITILFALMFKILPDVEIRWREVWKGAIITTLLFILGKFLLGLYFNYTHIASVYGAAGSVIIILIWVYYSSQIFFIGAEVTKLLAKEHGKRIITTHDSIILQKSTEKQP